MAYSEEQLKLLRQGYATRCVEQILKHGPHGTDLVASCQEAAKRTFPSPAPQRVVYVSSANTYESANIVRFANGQYEIATVPVSLITYVKSDGLMYDLKTEACPVWRKLQGNDLIRFDAVESLAILRINYLTQNQTNIQLQNTGWGQSASGSSQGMSQPNKGPSGC